ncbi:hypothetical Protein YC6258_02746 [Gynuella sunshinyii YC6258]|uniref:Uncharacterized protein n=1 Tax=Gynuella sunshinyii YC6258 TaxID=1445510 RepID=A0A0C5VWJ5_9GAMM|nr:hypothetical Protein YC6258_02746 [Gynuella sunshinyii YC6258]
MSAGLSSVEFLCGCLANEPVDKKFLAKDSFPQSFVFVDL